jgi:hypothetical protein
MATIADMADALQEQVTSGVRQAQEINLAALEVARDFAALFAPARRDGRDREVVKDVPDVTRVIDQVYGFAGQMLELQHDYAVRAWETLWPVTHEPHGRRTAAERRAEDRRAAAEERKAAAEKS